MNGSKNKLSPEFDQLYDQYVKPVEAEHTGEYVAVERGGRMIFGTDVREVALAAIDSMSKGSYVYKVGERAAGRWR
jgi:hypothetical protein